MINLIDYILDLFRDEGQAQAFVTNPDQALADAGLSTVTSAQLQSVASTAIPSLATGGSGDAVADLQQAVSTHYGFTPDFAPQPDFSPSADVASNNSFMSPTTNISDDHSLSFGVGDITLGDKTTAQGDGAVLGNGNTVNDSDIHAGSGSTVTVGDGDAGTIIQTSGHGTTTVSGGNTTSVENNSTVSHTSTVDNSLHDSSVHSSSIVDASVHDTSVHDTSVHDSSDHDSSIHETMHADTGLDAHLGF